MTLPVRAALLAALLAVAGCAASEMAPEAEVTRRAYGDGGDTSLTLYTVVSNRSEAGAHTALLIDADQRVLWDPAGSFRHPRVPERNDLLFGVTPDVLAAYEDYHARETFRLVKQTVRVSPAVARQAMRLAAVAGPAGSATCSISTTGILRQLPGFATVPRSWFPKRTMAAFGALPGVTTEVVTDLDADADHGVVFVPTRPDRTALPAG